MTAPDVRRRRHSADARGVDRAAASSRSRSPAESREGKPNTQATVDRARGGRRQRNARRGTRVQRPEVLRDPREPLAGVGEDDDRRPARLQLEPRATVENRGGDTSNGYAIEVRAARRVVQREIPSAGGPDLDLDRGAQPASLGDAIPVDERDVLGRVGATQDGFEWMPSVRSPAKKIGSRARRLRARTRSRAQERRLRYRRRARGPRTPKRRRRSPLHQWFTLERDEYRPPVGCGVVAVALLEALRVPPPHP